MDFTNKNKKNKINVKELSYDDLCIIRKNIYLPKVEVCFRQNIKNQLIN